MEKENKKRLIIFGALVLTIVVVFSGITYAFFSVGVSSTQEKLNLSTGTMELTFADNDNGIDKKLGLGQSVTKKFKIINSGTLEASMSLDWYKLVNTYTNGSLTYSLSYSETEDGTPTNLLTDINVPVSSEELSQTIESEISVPAHETHYYYLTITLNDLPGVDQNPDKDAEFHTMFSANEPVEYRYYTLTVDPNGGTWRVYTAPQTYQLKNNETKDITGTPTKTGYNFGGWKLTGLSSTFDGSTFTMGIGDSKLTAEWNIKKIQVTYNGETQEVDYGSTVDLGEPPVKTGHTFTGWEKTGGEVQGNTLIATSENDITVTPTYVPDEYKYIVYHNQQNKNGIGYTIANTDDGDALYDTEVTPPVRTNYTGFQAPTPETKKIVEDVKKGEDGTPTNNVFNYNYMRNKHNLTINPNGGLYGGETEKTVVNDIYFDVEYPLEIPTKTGYEFTNWSKDGVALASNAYTMGDADAEVTANWTEAQYSVTLNANGGNFGSSTSTTSSITVTYNSTYGDLPEPTYTGYTFLGWFTAQTGGSQVTTDTPVTITVNQTLYAHWKEITAADKTLAALKVTPNDGSPSFGTVPTTDEGVYSMEDDYGTSYYYRGAATKNYVKFGKWAAGTANAGKDMWWRIIRVNGDGSIRMIYDGTQGYDNANNGSGSGGADRFIKTDQAWNANWNDAKYVGWMFGGNDGAASTSKSGAQTNTTDSDIKEVVDGWYETNLKTQYGSYIADAVYCNDRSTPPNGTTWWTSQAANDKLGFAQNVTPYGAFSRFITTGAQWNKTNPSPKFTCDQENDMFTVDQNTVGSKTTNGSLKNPVGLITADEAVAAGAVPGVISKYHYLYKNSSYWIWSLSPCSMNIGGYASVFRVTAGGNLANRDVDYTDGAVAPVISLKAEYAAQLTGEGTTSSPFQISGVA